MTRDRGAGYSASVIKRLARYKGPLPRVKCVGIFWGCPTAGGETVLLADKTPVDQAEEYGDFRTHGTGHAEFWERLARLGATELEKRGLPTAPAWYEYETVPRGRVVYRPKDRRFIVYADSRLQDPTFVALILAEFGIPVGLFEMRSD